MYRLVQLKIIVSIWKMRKCELLFVHTHTHSDLDWLGRHWYVFVVLLVMIVVVCVFLCGCVVRRSKLGHYHMEMNHNR